ncbi:unnamed protein product [Rotaria sordida]|uniref:Uncharacterized protein n=1 Tax=Rotaria sordida TaxID=392033 RepID=A0A814VWA5_9BILA|nr:unnamed protein product [Rotaria sordida]CAF1201054.1 unnamed protein product [Rotaria sordida]CAF1256846.1 unnamed protein product [Rotaria sordida]
MLFENRRLLLFIIPICIAIAIYPIPFDGKQIISLDAPLITTFDVLVNHIWKFHPFIIHTKELKKINSTCSYYEITDRIPFISSLEINIPSTYYVQMNIDRENNCLTSIVHTQLNIMHAYHQYCMHKNTLKPTTTIITDQVYDKLRKEMMIYSTE